MNPEPDSPSERETFLAAVQQTDLQKREAFLADLAIRQPELIQRVRHLLAARPDAKAGLLGHAIHSAERPVRRQGDTTWSHGRRETYQPPIDIEQQPIIDRYQLLEEIGRGGMGTVYMASQLQPVRRRVAVKVINPGMNSRKVLGRFEAERQTLAVMEHPNIARVLDGGTTSSGLPYFVMELVRGVSILKFCRENDLPLRERLELFIDVCRAVQHAHQKGIIHRDLKPSNVLVETHDNAVIPKVIDFGIAKAIGSGGADDPNFTGFHEVLGTPMYMSPEQAEFHAVDVDTRSDVYSLGVLLYELVTDQPPFDPQRIKTAGYPELFQIIHEETPPRPSSLVTQRQSKDTTAIRKSRETIPTSQNRFRNELDWIVMKAMEKSRLRRYQTALELAEDVRDFLDHKPIAARPPSVLYRIQKTARRHRALIGGGIIAVLALVVGTFAALWQAHHAKSALALAEERNEQVAEANEELRRQIVIAEKARAEANELLFATEVHMAGVASAGGDAIRARNLLLRQMDPERRALTETFTWRYLNRCVEISPEWRRSFGGEIRCARLSPDHRWVAIAAKDSILRIVDVSSGTAICQYPAWVRLNSAAWSPDGRQIVCACVDGTVKLFSFGETGQDEEAAAHRKPKAPEYALQLVQSLVAQTSPEAGKYRDKAGEANDALFTPDGALLLTAGDDTLVRVWDRQKESLITTLNGHSRAIERLALSPDGSCLATASSDETFRLWNLKDYTPRGNPLKLPGRIVSAAFSVDGSMVAAGGITGDMIIVESETGEVSRHKVLDGIESLGFLSNPCRLVAGDRAGVVRAWQLSESAGSRFPENETLTWTAHQSRVQALVTDELNGTVLSGCRGGQFTLWNADRPLPYFQMQSVGAMDFSNDGNLLLGSHQLVRVEPDENYITNHEPLSPSGWNLIAVSSGSQRAVLASNCQVLVSNLQDNSAVSQWDCTRDLYRVAISPDGSLVATADYSGEWIQLRNATNGRVVREIPTQACRCLAFSPDNSVLAAGYLDHAVLYSLNDENSQIVLTGHSNTLSCVSFSPDGSRIATGSGDRHIRIWDTTSGRMVMNVAAHAGSVHSVNFSSDGTRLVSASEAGRVRVWHARSMQMLLDLGIPGQMPARTAQLSPDNRRLAVLDASDTLTVFEAVEVADPPNPKFAEDVGPDSGLELSEFVAVGDLPGGSYRSLPGGISADGQLVVGHSHHADGFSPFVWCAGNGIQRLGPPFPEARNGECACVSDDHIVFGGSGGIDGEKGYSPRLWYADGSTRKVADGHGMVVDLSSNGRIAAGHVGTASEKKPFLFADDQLQWLQLPSSQCFGVVASLSADGNVALGTRYQLVANGASSSDDQHARWKNASPVVWVNGAIHEISSFDPDWNWKAIDVSCDGSTVVGICWAPGDGLRDRGSRMFIWRNGEVQLLEPPHGFLEVCPKAMSADGSVIVGVMGQTRKNVSSHAFLWNATLGIVDLNEALSDDPRIRNWHLADASDISANGRQLVGYGLNPEGNLETWRLRLGRIGR